MTQLPYDPKEVREECRHATRSIAQRGGAPTVAFNVETGEVLRAFDRSNPEERDFIKTFAGLPFLPPAPHANLMMLAYREDEHGKRRITRSLMIRPPETQPSA